MCVSKGLGDPRGDTFYSPPESNSYGCGKCGWGLERIGDMINVESDRSEEPYGRDYARSM